MPVSSEKNQQKSSLRGNSPRLLAIDQKQPSFVKLAVKMNENGIHSPQFRWASKMEATLSLLRTEHIDCILYVESYQFMIDSENRNQFLRNLQAIRTSNPITPVIVIVDQLPEELWEKCCSRWIELSYSRRKDNRNNWGIWRGEINDFEIINWILQTKFWRNIVFEEKYS